MSTETISTLSLLISTNVFTAVMALLVHQRSSFRQKKQCHEQVKYERQRFIDCLDGQIKREAN